MEQAERDALLAKLRQQHGDIDPFTMDGQLVVLARPRIMAEWDRYQNVMSQMTAAAASGGPPVDVAASQRLFVQSCVVHPSAEEFKALLERFPASSQDLAPRCNKLLKAQIEEVKNV